MLQFRREYRSRISEPKVRDNDYIADFQDYVRARKHRYGYDFPNIGREDDEEMKAEPEDAQNGRIRER